MLPKRPVATGNRTDPAVIHIPDNSRVSVRRSRVHTSHLTLLSSAAHASVTVLRPRTGDSATLPPAPHDSSRRLRHRYGGQAPRTVSAVPPFRPVWLTPALIDPPPFGHLNPASV